MRKNNYETKYQKIGLVFAVLAIILAGCKESNGNTSVNECSSEAVFQSSIQNSEATESISDKNDVAELSSEQPSTDVKENSSDNKQTSSKINVESTTENIVDENPQTESKAESSLTDSIPTVQNALPDDARAIADKLLQQINKYRVEQGTPAAVKLNGLSEYAEYRSRQLTTNFDHDPHDEHVAATALEYGKYIDPTMWRLSDEAYYTACCREAIAKAGYIGTVEYVAKELGILAKNSPEHWAYVGSRDYPYIAIGITYDLGMWFCDIAMSQTNEYEK